MNDIEQTFVWALGILVVILSLRFVWRYQWSWQREYTEREKVLLREIDEDRLIVQAMKDYGDRVTHKLNQQRFALRDMRVPSLELTRSQHRARLIWRARSLSNLLSMGAITSKEFMDMQEQAHVEDDMRAAYVRRDDKPVILLVERCHHPLHPDNEYVRTI